MGAEQSKQDDQEQRRKNQEESSMGSGTALAVGAAVGTALLAGLALYRSSVSDDRVDQTRIQSHILEARHHFQGVAQYDYEGSDRRYESYSHGGRPSKSSTFNKAISLPKTSLKIMSYNV